MHFKVQSWIAQSLYKQIGHLQMEMCEFIKLAGETIAMLRIIQDKLLNFKSLKESAIVGRDPKGTFLFLFVNLCLGFVVH